VIKVGTRQGLYWKSHYFKAVTNKPIKWFDKHNAAEIGPAIDSDCNSIERALSDKSLFLFSSAVMFVSALAVAFYLSPELCFIGLLILPFQIGATYFITELAGKIMVSGQERYKKAGGIAAESLEGVKTVASCNAQEDRARTYQKELEPLKKFAILMGVATGVSWSVFFASLFMNMAIGYFVGAIIVVDEPEIWGRKTSIEPYQISIVLNIMSISSMLLGSAMPSVYHIQQGKIAAARAAKIIDGAKKYDGTRIAIKLEGRIEFDEVCFKYPTKKDVSVLQGVSFRLDPGHSLAIVGETGCGKSTIIQLIEGFYYPNAGQIRIDGVDIREYDLSSLRSHIALVSQESLLFNCSIRENIKMGRLEALDKDIEAAAREASASEFIESLPEKYETWVGVKGSQLSGGQKQRIAIARSLLKGPTILLLDEATSALDINTEKQIQATLDKIMKDKTTIIVAQRINTVKSAKYIAVLSEGKIIEIGTYKTLTETESEFSKYLKESPEAESYKTEVDCDSSNNESQRGFKNSTNSSTLDTSAAMDRMFRFLLKYWHWLAAAILAALICGSCFPVFPTSLQTTLQPYSA
jgi:ATP-binding cassette, subfamily B (MDR/TAP), member 1